jgi:hypothetical protein
LDTLPEADVSTVGFPDGITFAPPGPSVDRVMPVRYPDAARTGNALFLHTGWRSGGTWIWSRCRASSQVQGYYEPLHEDAAQFRRRDIVAIHPSSWHSNHSETAPYFQEYRDLIPKGRRGVALYRSRFAFDGFFRAPDDGPDPELEAYLRSLLARPQLEGKIPVLKFCRSLGRVGWLEQRFPGACHAVILRDPASQWRSVTRLLERQRNRYFTVAPLLVLARNAHHPLVEEALRALDVHPPRLLSDDMAYGMETCWRHIQRLGPEARYRAFLAFWTLGAVSSLNSGALVIDMGAIASQPGHRLSVEAALRATIGENIDLVPRRDEADLLAEPPAPGRDCAHQAAAGFVGAQAATLAPDRRDLILSKLETGAWPRPGPVKSLAMTKPSPLPIRPPSPRPLMTRLGTVFAVAFARGLQPLRRLHGSVVLRLRNP